MKQTPLAAVLLGGLVAAQKPVDMDLVIPFLAGQRLTPQFAEPQGWIDAQRYLVFDKVGKDEKAFFAVDARSGAQRLWFERGKDRQALAALPGVRAEQVTEALGDAGNYHWNADHSAYFLNVANDLLWFDTKTHVARRLTASPGKEVGEQFSPDGRLVSFIHDYDLHVVDTVGGLPRPLTDGGHEDLFFGRLDWVYQEELYGRGNFQAHWWSPDSTRIALLRLDEAPVREFTLVNDKPVEAEVEVSNYPKAGSPNPKVDLGVVDVFGGEVRYFDMSRYGTIDTLIVRVTWHPDGKEVFFQVQDREQTWLEMLAGDVETGDVRVVFREESDCWIESGPEPFWLEGGKSFLWQSERDGFEHVYWYDVKGEMKRRVTSGEFDIEEIHDVDEDAGVMFVSSDRTDPKELHLWRITLADDSDATQITKRPGWHDVEMAPDNGLYLDDFSAMHYRRSVTVHDASGKEMRSLVASDMRFLDNFGAKPGEFHQVETRDGFVMEAMLVKPKGYEEGKRYPTVCHTYSGPKAPRVQNRWRWRDYLYHHYLAQRGYLVWVCDNRSASGKGRTTAKACYRDMGTGEMRDLEDGVKWLVDNGYTDPKRVAIWGWSYGGYQTCFNLTHSKVWKVGMAVNPVTDWRFYDTIYTERYMGLPQTNPEGYARASVLDAAENLHGDLLLVHATMDDNVHMQNSMQFAHALQKAGKQFRFMAYPRVRHGIGDLQQQLHLFQMMTDFLGEKL